MKAAVKLWDLYNVFSGLCEGLPFSLKLFDGVNCVLHKNFMYK